ncbi:hypodermin-A-like isoform X2 [Convolutriloba macropyga]|uniref:hypodermin-A-like isoform X2 n=1 Tax=Convolutriloba macropyga TaxID=536237 RepID=UPI003F51B078
MLLLTVHLLLLSWVINSLVAAAGTSDQQEETRSKRGLKLTIKAGDRIVGGGKAKIEDYPYMVSLRIYKVKRKKGESSLCGGSITNDSIVVTARHCLDEKIEKGYLSMGTTKKNGAKGSYKLNFDQNNVVLHPNKEVDVALLDFGKDKPFTNKYKIGLNVVPVENWVAEVGQKVTVVGWGRTSVEGDGSSDYLKSADIRVEGMASCDAQNLWQFCAGGINKDNKPEDSCSGDSGGPVECTYTKNETGPDHICNRGSHDSQLGSVS